MCIRDRFCNVPNSHVLQNLDVEYLYEAPLAMEQENLAKVACDLDLFIRMTEILNHLLPVCKIRLRTVEIQALACNL